jgi:hypothetical protein
MSASTLATPDQQSAWRDVVTKAWTDDKYKQRLIDDPNSVLQEANLPLPEGVNFVVVENEPSRVHLVLPARPEGGLDVTQLHLSDYDPGF